VIASVNFNAHFLIYTGYAPDEKVG
jgi:hypothetical protein